jgi:pimeloyl-ACP methyl ester carboxylesterase
MGGDPVALLHVLDTLVDTSREELAAIAAPTVVVAGESDERFVSARELAAVIGAPCVAIPGTHATAMTSPALGLALRDVLTAVPTA